MKKYLLTGLVILTPAVLTLMIVLFLFNFFTAPLTVIVDPLIFLIENKLNIALPDGLNLFLSRVFSLIFLCIFILLLGVITRWLIVKNILNWGNQLISKIPLVKTIYKVSKDMFSALLSSDGKKAFKKPVMFPFPERPHFAVGFQAGEVAEECQRKVKTPLVSVFSPTAPHPISGFLFLVPKEDVYDIDMTNQDAVKFLVSCGMIVPKSEPPSDVF
ncbi:MAG: hypothetical protein A3E80_05500 [Chlamydiae bacterium RIFCSPHIGHO2_12_FULL_49_9]|nr:MAG: hypothetical protein A3E80_05500 [Chlamydiae bacterium RIFCSPHIGHO2_12_FULL_49_9]